MLQVLVVDDESGIRNLLRRLLVAEFGAEVHEAVDGLAALEQLSRLNPALTILDLTLPVMDGVETLEAIRQSPRWSSLPVVVMTASRQEPIVRQVIKLGVSDFLLKPLKRETIIDRLSRLLRWQEPTIAGCATRLLDLEPGAEILIVDGSAEFRHFFRHQLATRYTIREAANGVEALRACFASPPAAIFMAMELDLLSADMLARKLRADPRFRSLALIAVTPQPDKVLSRNGYDGVLTRTFVPETLNESFSKLLATGEQPSLLAEGSPVVKQMVLAAFQMCHMWLGTEVVIDNENAVDETASRRWCRAAVEVHTRDGAIDLRVLASHNTARALTGRRLESDSHHVGERDMLDTLQEIAATLSETLSQTLTRRGLPSGCGVPRAECMTSVGLPPIPDGQEYVQFALLAPSDGSRLIIRLARLTGGSASVTKP